MGEAEITITSRGPVSFTFSELWKNRELLYFLAWRDVKVKYKQTYLGVLWVILQPLLLMAIFYIIFFRTLNIAVGMSYPVYASGGLILWGLLSSGINNSSESMLGSAQMIRKIYFPRILIPMASVLTALLDFFIAFLVFIVLLFIFRQPVSWHILYCFPLAVTLTTISSLGLGALLAALNVKYRDFRYLLPFGMQLIFFSSQIVYSLHALQKDWIKLLLFCNPLNGALELFSYPLRNEQMNVAGILISSGMAILFLLAGLLYFKRTEVYFADVI
ncbi:ABC transporter permease [Agriterribacter humi]|jgi:lipopolysaccharide transport system permease protein|uniref:ABC transporter permease n=1 Tax=Agriterribacter humi TaxID=1104781 RepID=UPI0012658017|nr:ABC transporter permease [Agriterribacter humi]